MMKLRATKDLIQIFEGMPRLLTIAEIREWLLGSSAQPRPQSYALLSYVMSRAKKFHLIVNMNDDASLFSLNPAFYDIHGLPKDYDPRPVSQRIMKKRELIDLFQLMPPSTYVEALAWITGADIVDGRVPKEAYLEGSKIWSSAKKSGVICRDEDGLWIFAREGADDE